MPTFRTNSGIPQVTGNDKEDISLLRNSLYRLEEELRYLFNHLDASNIDNDFLRQIKNGDIPIDDEPQVQVDTDIPYSDENPLMDGVASAGVSESVSRGDHVHPSDTSKADANHSHPTKQDKLTAGNGIGLNGATISAYINAATASTTTAELGNGADVNLQTFAEYDPNNIFSNARYSSSYGYGIKVAKAGKYLLMASGNVATSSTAATAVTLALRKVTSGGTSSYLMRSQMVHASTSAYTVSIAPFVATLAANDCLSLFLSNAKTTVNGLNLTAIFLG